MIPLMVVDESDRVPKVKYFSCNDALRGTDDDENSAEVGASFVKLPSQCGLQRTTSVPTSFKERKKHWKSQRRIKTSPANSSKSPPFKSLSKGMPADRKRKWKTPDSRYPEQHDTRRWAYATRDEYNRYMIPRTWATERVATKEKDTKEDLLGLAFVDEQATD